MNVQIVRKNFCNHGAIACASQFRDSLPVPLESFKRSALEAFAVVGVRDANQFARALAQVLAVKVRDTIFGDDVMHVGPGRHHTGAWLEYWRQAADTLVGYAWQRQNRFAAFA